VFGDVDLGESSFSAQIPQQRTKLLVLLRVDGFLHRASAPCTSVYPNLGYFEPSTRRRGTKLERSEQVWQLQRPLQVADHIERQLMIRTLTVLVVAAFVVLGAPSASADPSCGVHTGPLDCGFNGSTPTPAEQSLATRYGPVFPGTPAPTMVMYARGACAELRGGSVTRYVVKDLADHLGTSMEAAGQFMDGAMEADCSNLHVGADGVAR
jgi:hypothetical protein